MDYPFDTKNVPTDILTDGRYLARFARTPEEIDAALRLRFEVFNLELNEGLESSYLTGRDEDEFDQTCHHLIVIEKDSNDVIGTYRLRTVEMARAARGFYSENEFDFSHLPESFLTDAIESGRACIAREHRNTRVLFLLWKGLALYMMYKRKRYMFGCCSLMSQDCREGMRALQQLQREGYVHETLRVEPRPEFACGEKDFLTEDSDNAIELPRLFGTYLRIGAKVCGKPVIDRQFKTIDFFIVFDLQTVDDKYYQMLFAEAEKLLAVNGYHSTVVS
ncbi:MAG: GNAT family N-acetyltransferase [Pyrinomonadaceae bacterium]|nr:GNAT family N-acetyltransferase [Pyrinomonadaceae bacterium]